MSGSFINDDSPYDGSSSNCESFSSRFEFSKGKGELPSDSTSTTSHWIPDEEVKECPLCNAVFRKAKRKHHCRACGKVICDKCSLSRLALPELGFENKVRVCDSCRRKRADVDELASEVKVQTDIQKKLKSLLNDKVRQIDTICVFLKDLDSELPNCTSGSLMVVDDAYAENGLKVGLSDFSVQMKDRIKAIIIENQQKNMRISEMRQQIVDLQRMVGHQNDQIRELRTQAEESELLRREKEGLESQVEMQHSLLQSFRMNGGGGGVNSTTNSNDIAIVARDDSPCVRCRRSCIIS